MTLTAAQVRRARALLGWTSPKLARRSQVGFDRVLKAQCDERIKTLGDVDLAAIRAALECAGVTFAPDAEGRPGAMLMEGQG